MASTPEPPAAQRYKHPVIIYTDSHGLEWVEVWADFDPAALRAAFVTPSVEGVIADESA